VDRFRAAIAVGFEDLRDGEILVLDLTEVTFSDSHGLDVLVTATEGAQQRRASLPIAVEHTRPVIRPIELTGLDTVLALFDTVEDVPHPRS
jgi:anti-sigma B factor antagonist